MTDKEYKQFIKHFDNKEYFHGAIGSNYTDYSWNGVSPAIKSYADEVQRMFPKVKRIIDVGCAKGYLVKELSERGYECYGFDVSRWAIMEGIKEFPELGTRITVGDIVEGMTFANDQKRELFANFDLVILSEVLEHIPEEMLDTVFQNICKLSTKYVLLDMPLEKHDDEKDPTHITIHSRKWWDKKIDKHFDYYIKDDLHRVAWDFFPLIKKKAI